MGAGVGLTGLLAACGSGDTPGGAEAGPGTVSLGSNESGTTFAKQRDAMAADYVAHVEANPYTALYEAPGLQALLPPIAGLQVLVRRGGRQPGHALPA